MAKIVSAQLQAVAALSACPSGPGPGDRAAAQHHLASCCDLSEEAVHRRHGQTRCQGHTRNCICWKFARKPSKLPKLPTRSQLRPPHMTFCRHQNCLSSLGPPPFTPPLPEPSVNLQHRKQVTGVLTIGNLSVRGGASTDSSPKLSHLTPTQIHPAPHDKSSRSM